MTELRQYKTARLTLSSFFYADLGLDLHDTYNYASALRHVRGLFWLALGKCDYAAAYGNNEDANGGATDVSEKRNGDMSQRDSLVTMTKKSTLPRSMQELAHTSSWMSQLFCHILTARVCVGISFIGKIVSATYCFAILQKYYGICYIFSEQKLNFRIIIIYVMQKNECSGPTLGATCIVIVLCANNTYIKNQECILKLIPL